MLTCKDAAELTSRGLDTHLTRRQRFQLRLHLTMCRACRAYKAQIESLHRLLKMRFGSADLQPPQQEASLSWQAKERLKDLLSDASHLEE